LRSENLHFQKIIFFSKALQVPDSSHLSGHKQAHEQKIVDFNAKMMSDNKDQVLEGLVGIRKLLSIANNPPIQQVVDSGIVPRILSFMSLSESPAFQFEAAWTITNICSGTSQHVQYIVQLGGLDATINLLSSTSTEVLEQAVWTLGNIAGDNVEYRNLCIQKNSMERLLAVFFHSHFHSSLQRNTVWAMSNLVRSKPTPAWQDICKGVAAFIQILKVEEFDEVFVDALWAISWISEAYIQEIINFGCIPLLVHHLKNPQLNVIVPALRALGNIVTGNDEQTHAVVSDPDFIPRVFELTFNQKSSVKKEAFWLLSNVAAGTESQIQLILNHPQSMEILKRGLIKESSEISVEAAWAIGNLVSNANTEQIEKLVNTHHYLDLLKFMLHTQSLKLNEIGLEAALNVLGAVEEENSEENPYINIFKQKGLVKKIKSLSAIQQLSASAEGILVYFDGSEGEEFSIDPEYEIPQSNPTRKQNNKAETSESEEDEQEGEESDVDDYENDESSDSSVFDTMEEKNKKKITNYQNNSDDSDAEQKQPQNQNFERED